ncbi:S-adenosyl-L-methionine-dependent methyltransferase [Hesseltinella vesiculosa]|uniref:S-adenosyl-L-methionine-dependent methyltransferase n=1 Tax=Hesseltinella vesiculosa TaxID=101127 RepID=A0A1X2GQA6_9FUNG|nr:S-adenosyl-L-methionine-dependent methyltransferase [Hesseltinella vesiculosa]
MGSGQSKHNKDNSRRQSTIYSYNSSPEPGLTPGKRLAPAKSLRSKASFTRPVASSSSTTASSSSSGSRAHHISTLVSTNNAAPQRPPLFTGLQSNSFFLPKNWQVENADQSLNLGIKLLYPMNMLTMVVPKFVKKALVVDVGCGQGAWIMDMASQYPKCHFIGLETSVERLPRSVPPLQNVTYDLIDTQRHLPFEDNSVDVLQLRAQNLYMDRQSWNTFLTEANRVLKMGGFIHIMDYIFNPTGSVLAESFSETLNSVFVSLDIDTSRPAKLAAQLPEFGFEMVQTLAKRVPFANDKIGQLFTVFTLHRFEEAAPDLAPAMGLSEDEYKQRAETVTAQCVNCNDVLTWHAYAARKSTNFSPSSSAS